MSNEQILEKMKAKTNLLSIEELQGVVIDIEKNEKWDLWVLYDLIMGVLLERMECQSYVDFCKRLETEF